MPDLSHFIEHQDIIPNSNNNEMKLEIKAFTYLLKHDIVDIADFMLCSPSPNCTNVSKLLIIYVRVSKAKL